MEEEKIYPLHKCVFEGNVKKLSALLRVCDVTTKDKHGNTALHLSVMLGRKECTLLLLAHGAPVKLKNLAGWSPLSEAVSYGDRQTILSLVKKLRQQIGDSMTNRRPNLVKALSKIPDFYMELKWDFQSWLPLVSRFLPSDLCQVHKKGTSIRLDSTLVDFNGVKWEHGDITLLFDGKAPLEGSLIIMDNSKRVYQVISDKDTESEIEDEVDALMSQDLVCAQMSTKSISFTRSQSGWIFKEDKKETIGQFRCNYYSVSGILFEARKRREHLSEDDVRKNKQLVETFTKGNQNHLHNSSVTEGIKKEPLQPARRESLPPPPKSRVTWEEYIKSPPGKHPVLGRELVQKELMKSYKATVAMSEDFPLTVDMLLNVLEVVAPFKHFDKLRKFVQVKLPPGFPVKLDIPIFPAISARVTFQQFRFENCLPDKLFQVPENYVEDPNRFPEL